MVPKSYFNVYWWFFTTTTLHKKHNKPKNYRYHQARFFVTPAINSPLLQVFSNRLIVVILEGRGDWVLKSTLALTNPRQ
ncbi:hypothetical protein F7226_07080 [Helicobacter pylori]|nr:hypothetical protein [Helicobacter pylori]